MSSCTVCNRKQTRLRSLSISNNICSECIVNINKINNNDNTTSTNDDMVFNNNPNISSDLIYIDARGKLLDGNVSENIEIDHVPTLNTQENFKDALLASLYSQVEFLRSEIEEKNLLIHTLIIRDSDIYDKDGNIKNARSTLENDRSALHPFSSTYLNSTLNRLVREPVGVRDVEDNDAEDNFTDEFSDDQFHSLYLQYIQDMDEANKINISSQLDLVRTQKHNRYLADLNRSNVEEHLSENKIITADDNVEYNDNENHMGNENEVNRKDKEWKKGTYLITGSSLVCGLEEKRMGNNVKVRGFPGATIRDFYNYLVPLLEKKPSNIILMAGSNDSINKPSDEIVAEILLLKQWILNAIPDANIIISCPPVRMDNQKARLTILNLRKKLSNLKINFISNENINDNHLGHKGLHLNKWGSAILAMNYLSHIRKH